jgi:glutamate dehydrogenase
MARQGDVANMNVHDTLPAADGDRTRSALIGAAAAALAGRNRDVPPDFVAELFGHAVPEDFARYRPEELVGIAEQSWALLQERKSGAPKIRFEPAAAKPGVAVLEMINDDMPFLVDSIVGEISERDLDIRLLVHPVFTVERSETGKLNAFRGAHKGNGRRESFIHIHVDDDGDDAARADLVRTLADILAEVRVCVQDWRPMLARLSEVTAELRAAPPPLPADEIAEAIEFLQWIATDNFTLPRARDYAYTDS